MCQALSLDIIGVLLFLSDFKGWILDSRVLQYIPVHGEFRKGVGYFIRF